jgi:hypothetical protein
MLNIFSHKAPAKTLTRLRGTFSSYEEKSFARKSLTCFLNISKDSTPLFSLPGKGFTVSRVSPFRIPNHVFALLSVLSNALALLSAESEEISLEIRLKETSAVSARGVKKGPLRPFRAALAQEADYRVSSFLFLSNHLHLAA